MWSPRASAAGGRDVAVRDGRVLDAQDRVGAVGQRRAGGDAERGARRERLGGDVARGHLAGHGERRRRIGVGRADGVAVHRRAVEGREVDDAAAVLRGDPAQRVGERHALDGQRLRDRRDALPGLADLEQRYPPIRDIERAGWTKPGSPT